MGPGEPTEMEQPNEETPPEPEVEEKPAEEPEAEPEAEAEEKPEGEEPAAEEGTEPKTEPEAKAEEGRKRAGGWQRKIERLERQNEQLIQQLTMRGNGPAAPTNGKPAERTPAEQAREYIRAEAKQLLAEERQQAAQQEAQAEFQRRTAEVRARHPDFEDVVMSATDIPVSPAVTEALLTSEHGPEIMYQLASSPAELARISALPPLAAAREIGRLEAKVASVAPAPKTNKPALRPPVPPTSVNGSAAKTRDLESLNIREYKRAVRSGRR